MISADPSIKQFLVEMRYKPERALTPDFASVIFTGLFGRNEV